MYNPSMQNLSKVLFYILTQYIGDISTTKVFLSKTILHGSGLHSAKVGVETSFSIDVFDRWVERVRQEISEQSVCVLKR